jgi:hypothetical protein
MDSSPRVEANPKAPPKPQPKPAVKPPARPVTSRESKAPSAEAVAAAKSKIEAETAKGLPGVPADKPGKEQWVKDAKARSAALNLALETLKDAWFYGNMPFEAYSAASRKVWDFDSKISNVEYDLKASEPPAPGAAGECGDYLTPPLLGAMEKHPNNPLNIFGVIFLPVTLIVDGVTGLAKITGGCKTPPAPPAPPSPAKPATPRKAPPEKPAPKKPDVFGPGDFPTPSKDGPRLAGL